MQEDASGLATPQERDREIQYILEGVVNTLRSGVRELRHYSRPDLVPKPTLLLIQILCVISEPLKTLSLVLE